MKTPEVFLYNWAVKFQLCENISIDFKFKININVSACW